jgi:hypothetical protein
MLILQTGKLKGLIFSFFLVYNVIILPTLEQCPESLKWRNHDDVTCRDLLDQLKEKCEEPQQVSTRSYPGIKLRSYEVSD